MVSGKGTNMSHLILTVHPLCFVVKLHHWNMVETLLLCTRYFHSSLECHFSYTLNWISYLSGYSDQLSSKNNLTGRTVHFCIYLMVCIPSWQGSHGGLSFWCMGHMMQTVNRKSGQAITSQVPPPVDPLPPSSKRGLGTKCSNW